VNELGIGDLQVLLKCRMHAEEDEGKGIGPTFLSLANFVSLE